MSTKTETITPPIAQKYLATMTKNRNLRPRRVDQYADMMRSGQWKLTGEPIKFNLNGELIDGQHRLQAVIQSGKAVEFDVRRNLAPEVFMNLDTGGTRSPGDLLHIAGHEYAVLTASTIRMIHMLLEIESGTLTPSSMGKRYTPPAILLEWCEEYPTELIEAIKTVKTVNARSICAPPSLFAALYFLFAQHNKRGARDFFHTLTTGLGFEHQENDPIYQLRTKLLNFRQNRTVKWPDHYKAVLAIKAWNSYQTRGTIQNLKFSEKEAWPMINRRRTRLSEEAAQRAAQKKAKVKPRTRVNK